VRNVSHHGALIFAVHSDEPARTAGREVSEAADRFFNTYRLNDRAYAALRAIDLSSEDEPTRFAVAKMLRDMRRAGVEKDRETRVRLLELSNLIDRVGNQFSENIAKMEREIEVDGGDRLRGLPADYLVAHRPTDRGTIRITTNYPDFFPVMSYCDDGDVRRRLLLEFTNRAYPENLPVLEELLSLRAELARTLGYSSYATYALEDKMMGTPANARTFLDRMGRLLKSPAADDLRRYLERKRRDHPEARTLDLWDSEFFGRGYYDGKIRAEEFGVDTKRLRAYLPYVRVRDGLLELCRELFGITFRRISGGEVWHPSVEAYDVSRGGVPLGRCYLDLVPRAGKFSHAACFPVREGVAGIQLPQAALICNFIDPDTSPETARMGWEEVITFFHEFGHLLHSMLAGQPRWSFNGQDHVEWDFIEAPSQLFEEWARDPATLSRFARDPDTGEAIPVELLRRLQAASALGRPSRLLRQAALASVSLELYDHDPTGMDTSVAFAAAWNLYDPRPMPPEYHPQASFGHLTGYSAFYYTYLWSSVIARDLLSPFEDRGTLTDPTIAARYADEILAPGSSRPAAELIRAYLAREFNYAAFESWAREPANAEQDTNPT
jgi:thimet oligopeptidase